MQSVRRTVRPRLLARLAVISASLAVPSVWPNATIAQQPTFRSLTDVRERIPDEQDRPFVRETQSHRGWEVREDQFTIVATTSQEDARWAARQVMEARGKLAQVLDYFTTVHKQPDFGLNSLQVVIDDAPLHDRNRPLTTIEGVGIQTSVRINISPGQPSLQEQALRLREAGAFAMLHAAGLDGVLPPWTASGLATHAALQNEPQPAPKPKDFAPAGAAMGGQQWRWKRSAQDQLEEHLLDRTQAGEMVTFLLQGNDGEYAPAFLAQLRQAIAAGQEQAAAGARSNRRRGEDDPPASDTSFDQIAGAIQPQFAAWLTDPLVGQPVVAPLKDASAELLAKQDQMLLVLKLQRRIVAASLERKKVKIVTFNRAKVQAESASDEIAKPADMSSLLDRIGDSQSLPLATLDSSGRLLLTSDHERIQALLGFGGERYRTERSGDRWVLATRLEDGSTLQGWLENNPENKNRPLAKFAVIARVNRKSAEEAKPAPTKPAASAWEKVTSR